MKKYLAFLVTFAALAACTVTPQTPREGVLSCYYTVRVAYSTANDLRARGKLSDTQRADILKTGEQATAACDAARLAVGSGDLSTAEAKLKFANTFLIQLEQWLTTQGVKP